MNSSANKQQHEKVYASLLNSDPAKLFSNQASEKKNSEQKIEASPSNGKQAFTVQQPVQQPAQKPVQPAKPAPPLKSGLFDNLQSSSLFSKPVTNLFQNLANKPGGLFSGSAPATGGLFSNSAPGTGLFSGSTSAPGTGLFSGSAPGTGLFANLAPSGGGLFGNISSAKGLFGAGRQDEEGEDGEGEGDQQQQKQDSPEVDIEKSNGKYEYTQFSDKLLLKPAAKFKVNQRGVIEKVTVSLEQMKESKSIMLIVKSAQTKVVVYTGTLLKGFTEVKEINGRKENVGLFTVGQGENGKPCKDYVKIQFGEPGDGVQFLEKVQSVVP